jgi:CubicO group peptidase (beta-lactamase class C family)
MLLGMVIEAVTGRSVGQEMDRLFDGGDGSLLLRAGLVAMGRPPLSGILIDGYQPVPPPRVKMPALFDAFDGAPVTRAELHPKQVKLVSTNPSESGPTVRVRAADAKQSAGVERRTSFRLQNVTGAYSLSIGGPAGGIVTNSEDLATFWRALFDGKLVSQETLAEMERTVPTGENSKGVRVTWGLGFGRQQIAPGGAVEGVASL